MIKLKLLLASLLLSVLAVCVLPHSVVLADDASASAQLTTNLQSSSINSQTTDSTNVAPDTSADTASSSAQINNQNDNTASSSATVSGNNGSTANSNTQVSSNSTPVQGNPIQNISGLSVGQSYGLSSGSIKFSSLPAGSNYINFRQVNTNGGTGYEITSNMTNGSFTYDLTLPLPASTSNFVVKYVPSGTDLTNAQIVTQSITNNGDGTITIHGLNHFTVFVVDTNPSSVACIGAGSNCYSTIQGAVDAASSGNTISIQSGTYNETVYIDKQLTLTGSGNPTVTELVFWANNISISGITANSIINGLPIITSVTNPINNSNRSSVSLSGTGLASSNLTYTFTDGTHTVTSTATVSSSGNFSISNIDLSSLNDGSITVRVTLNDGNGHTSTAASSSTFKDTISPVAPTVSASTYINSAGVTAVGFNGTGEAGTTTNYTISDGVHTSLTGTGTVSNSGTFSFSNINVSSLNDGTITFSATITDSSGNTSGAGTTTSTKDTVAPAVSAGSNQVKRVSFTQTGTASDAVSGINNSTISWTQVSGPGIITFGSSNSLSTTISANTDGVYTVRLTVSDNAGNSNSSTFQLTWDTTAPTLSSNNVIAGWFTLNPTITLSASDNLSGLNNVKYSWDSSASATVGTTFTNGTTINIPSDGTHTLYLYADDTAGNSQTFSATYKLDTVDPIVTATNSSNSWVNSVPTIVVTASDTLPGSDVASIKYGWDAAASIAITDGTDLASTFPSDGTHILNLLVTDFAGRTGSFTGTYKVDRVAPTDPGLPSGNPTSPTNQTSQTWSWSVSTDATSGVAYYLVSVDGGATVNVGLATSHNTLLTEGTHTFSVQAFDNAGNSSSTLTATGYIVDTTAPVTTDSGTDALWHNSLVTVSLTCTDNLSGCNKLIYTIDGSDPTTSNTATTSLGSTASIALIAQGVYTIKYYSIDNAGNSETVKTAVNQVMIDTTAPAVSANNASNVTWHASNINITLSVSDAGGSGLNNVRYNWDSAATASVGTVFTNGTVINIPSDGTHTLYLYANDNAGNSQTFSGVYKLDTVPPTVNAGTNVSTNALISRTGTATDATSGVASVLWSANSGNVVFSAASSLTTNISATVDGVYTVTLTATDNAGNTNSSSFTFTWDTTAPNTTDNIDNSWHNTPVTITLTCVDSIVGCAHTYYTTDGSTPTTASSQGTSISLSGSNVYTVKYFSVDNLGNTEAVKTAVNQVMIDQTNPVISGVTITNNTLGNTLYVKNTDTVTLTATITDNNQSLITTNMITADLSALGGGSSVHPISYNSTSGLATWAVIVVSGTTNGNVSVSVNSVDVASNPATTVNQTILSDNTAPTTTDNTDSLWHNSNVTITLTCTDAGSGCAQTYYTTDGSTPTIASSTGTTITITVDGIYTIKYFSVDNAGNQSAVVTAVNQVKLDKTTPTGSWTAPAAGVAVNGTVTLTGTALDTLSGVASVQFFYKLNDGIDTLHSLGTILSSPFTTSWDTAGLSIGNYTLEMLITDLAGNTQTVTENVDIIVVITNVSATVTSDTNSNITWTTNANSTSRVIFDTVSHSALGTSPDYGYADTTPEHDFLTNHLVAVGGLSGDTTYYYRVISRINGGADSVSQEMSFRTFGHSFSAPSNNSGGGSSSSSSSPSTSTPQVVLASNSITTTNQNQALLQSNSEPSGNFENINTGVFAESGVEGQATTPASTTKPFSLPSPSTSAFVNTFLGFDQNKQKIIIASVVTIITGSILYYLIGKSLL